MHMPGYATTNLNSISNQRLQACSLPSRIAGAHNGHDSRLALGRYSQKENQ